MDYFIHFLKFVGGFMLLLAVSLLLLSITGGAQASL